MTLKLLVRISVTLISVIALSGCDREQPVEVFLPPEGDPTRGRVVFVKFDCHECHTIPDADLPLPSSEPPMVVMLGLRMHRVRDYGDLMTAVLYPKHAVSPKLVGALKAAGKDPDGLQMPVFANQMTVAEMIDLLAFLDAEYSRNMAQYQGKNG